MDRPFDILLGRKTYEIFAGYWQDHKEEGSQLNKAKKYVVSHSLQHLEWSNSVLLKGNDVGK
ncbi:hypothetical protein [Methanomethylovorans hollandica]|uniref:hypothetical protein n=1 Tax=Methanomethylovorans hollandica TaxID=101192 RepID=UPI001C0FC1E8|nr:hypothetical protein [Methanomethylovorans hollandica]